MRAAVDVEGDSGQKRRSSETKNMTASATSVGGVAAHRDRARDRRQDCSRRPARRLRPSSPALWPMPVVGTPTGQTQLTVTCGASSPASDSVSPTRRTSTRCRRAARRSRALARIGADHHDTPAPASSELRGGGLADEERALEVDVDRAVPVLLGHLGERLDVDDTGADDDRVEAAERLHRPLDGGSRPRPASARRREGGSTRAGRLRRPRGARR